MQDSKQPAPTTKESPVAHGSQSIQQTSAFTDNRSSSALFRQTLESIEGSPLVVAQRRASEMIASSPRMQNIQNGAARVAAQMSQQERHTEQQQDADSRPDRSSEIESEHDSEAQPHENGVGGVSEQGDPDNWFREQREAIPLLGGVHHLEYKKVNGEFVLGVASLWTDADSIHVALRMKGASAEWRASWENVRDKSSFRIKVKRKLDRAEEVDERATNNASKTKNTKGARSRSRSRSRNRLEVTTAGDKARQALIELRDTVVAAIAAEKRALKAFIVLSATEFSTEVAEILGERMPTVEMDTDATNADAGTVRYHTGAQGDPIPIIWYKPAASYPTVTVLDHTTQAKVVLSPFAANPPVKPPVGAAQTFGVAAANRPAVDSVFRNLPNHGKTRATQSALNDVLTSMGHKMTNLDGDHVTDLGFGGNDVIGNYWPLNSTINRYAFTGWRSRYYLNYKTGVQLNGDAEINKAPLNAGNLIGKYVRIVGEEATANPTGNNTAASGSSLTWGVSQNIVESAGTSIQEG